MLGVSRRALKSPRPPRDLEPLRTLVEHLLVSFPCFGYRRMHALLRRRQIACTRAEVRSVYVSLRRVGRRAPLRARTTDSRHPEPRYENLAKDLAIERPDQLWVADTTYVRIGGRFAYLALVEDAFSRKVMGWCLGFSNDAELVLRALDMALEIGTPEIHHSDQGRTYASTRYIRRLRSVGARPSMAAVGKAWENGLAERLNRTFKEEEIRRSEYRSLKEARASIAKFVALYNEERIHSAIGYRTPNERYRAEWNDSSNEGNNP